MNLIVQIFLTLTLWNHWVFCENNARIIGGITATETYPFMANFQLRQSSYKEWYHWCGSSIVSTRNAVTAAHCFKLNDGGSIFIGTERSSILVGTHRGDSYKTRYYIGSAFVHPQFVQTSYGTTHDIALLKTNETILYTRKVQPIKYCSKIVGANILCTVMGYGFTNPDRSNDSNTLLELKVKTILNSECKMRGLGVTEEHICTLPKEGHGICGGDSGGPLVTKKCLIGVVSFASPECGIGYPDAFLRISYYYDWLNKNVVG